MDTSENQDLAIPVDMRKKALPAVTIYGDNESRNLAKSLWSFVAGRDVRFLTPSNEEELFYEAHNSALIFINVPDLNDDRIFLARKLSELPGVVSDVMAITAEQDIRKRLQIMSQEFDGIYNREILTLPEFQNVFRYKLDKGIRRLNARLQEDEYKTFQGYLSASADAFIVFDKRKRIFFVSEHYLKTYPKSAHLFVRGMPVQKAFEGVAAEIGLAPTDAVYHQLKNFWLGQKGQLELTLKSGQVLRMTAVKLPEEQGTIISTTDITELTAQKTELAQRRKEVEIALFREQEASNLQKQFISMVSHEFRTPLTIVDGNAQILERRGGQMEAEESQRRLHTIRSAVSRLINMMEAVLSSNMLRTGKLDLNYEEFDLRELACMLCDEQKGLSRNHIITCDVERLPECVYLDKKIITLILTNLLSNAVKYTREEPNISLTGSVDENHIIITVSDNGVGIPQDELNQIFERFFRATTSVGVSGTGVGLSLVKELVHLHKGFVKVESTLGKGTIFEIRLPLILKEVNSDV